MTSSIRRYDLDWLRIFAVLLLVPFPLPIALKYGLIVGLTILFTFLIYEGLVRRVSVTRYLLSIKQRKPDPAQQHLAKTAFR